MTLSNDSLNYFKLLLNTHFTQQIRPSKEEEEEEEHLRKSHIRSPGEKDVMKLQLKNALRNKHLVISGPSSLRRILSRTFQLNIAAFPPIYRGLSRRYTRSPVLFVICRSTLKRGFNYPSSESSPSSSNDSTSSRIRIADGIVNRG